MAKTTNSAPEAEEKTVDMEELVDYTAPLTTPDAEPIYVGVNGENIQIQRGVPVKIKRKFLEVLQHAQEQEYAAYRAQQAAQRAVSVSLADL